MATQKEFVMVDEVLTQADLTSSTHTSGTIEVEGGHAVRLVNEFPAAATGSTRDIDITWSMRKKGDNTWRTRWDTDNNATTEARIIKEGGRQAIILGLPKNDVEESGTNKPDGSGLVEIRVVLVLSSGSVYTMRNLVESCPGVGISRGLAVA